VSGGGTDDISRSAAFFSGENKTMKVIVIGLGSAGDVHPNVGLALALQRRGHNVVFVAGSVFRSLAERAELEFIGLGTDEDYYEAVRDPDMWNPFRAFRVVTRRLILPMLRPIYELIAERNEPGETVVAAPGTAFGARMAQEKLGVPLATMHLQPIMLRSTVEPGCYGFPDIINHRSTANWRRRPTLFALSWAYQR
jgi:UDP:flavonoid glycosyltransferase YjiC (YdhE family)